MVSLPTDLVGVELCRQSGASLNLVIIVVIVVVVCKGQQSGSLALLGLITSTRFLYQLDGGLS